MAAGGVAAALGGSALVLCAHPYDGMLSFLLGVLEEKGTGPSCFEPDVRKQRRPRTFPTILLKPSSHSMPGSRTRARGRDGGRTHAGAHDCSRL